MKTAPGFGSVQLCTIPEPQPQHGQVRIRVRAAGLCGTDLHIYRGEFRSFPPVVLGHEVSGEIDLLGEGVTGLSVGEAVTTETYFSVCGSCRYCRQGRVNLCLARRSIGSAVNGGFAEYLVVPAANIHRLPQGVDFRAGAFVEPLACVVHALQSQPAVCAGDLAVVAGPGPIGLLALQVLKASGARVLVLGVSADEARLAAAAALGADAVANVEESSALEVVAALCADGAGADTVVECAGAEPSARELLQLVRRGGRYVQIGIFGRPVTFDADQIVYRELTVTGTNASTPPAWPRAIELLRSGQVRTQELVTDVLPLEAWEEAFCPPELPRGRIKVLFCPD